MKLPLRFFPEAAYVSAHCLDADDKYVEVKDAIEFLNTRRAEVVAPGWIPVKERVPEAKYGPEGEPPIISDDVLVRFNDGYVEMANYDCEDKVWTSVANLRVTHDSPTHWMPLPAAPEGEG